VRVALAVVLAVSSALLGAVLGASPASAHASLVASTPAQDARLDVLPGEVSFEFSEEMSAPAYVVVTAPDGTALADGEPVVDGATVRQAVSPSEATGTFTMAYRAVSEDGHPVTGQITFDVGEASTPTSATPTASAAPDDDPAPAAASSSDDDGDGGGWPTWLVAGVPVVLFALALLLFVWSRRAEE
jgi:copper resistance protein C